MMEETQSDFTMSFRQLSDWTLNEVKSGHVPRTLWALHKLSQHKLFPDWSAQYAVAIEMTGLQDNQRKTKMDAVNPRYVLRNWIAQEVISRVEQDDFSLVNTIQEVLRQPYLEQEVAELRGWADPPPDWAKHIQVSCSS